MSNGPVLIYDKSAMQRLSRNEADWLTHFFRCNITPIYLLEVMGDLSKKATKGSPAQMVASMAAKTIALGSLPNIHHHEMIDMEILGNPIEMRGVPALGGGKEVVDATGKRGIFFDESPEERTLRRWSDGRFIDEEHRLADIFRSNAKAINLGAIMRASKSARTKDDVIPTSIGDLLEIVDLFLDDRSAQFRTLNAALDMFDQPFNSRRHVKKHWILYGRPLIKDFLPYTHFCLRVSMLFYHGVGSGLIGERPTNAIDLQYLYYLPFCRIFTSADKLHHELAPHFLQPDRQLYVKGDELQTGLKRLVEYYAQHEKELAKMGTMGFARYPPLEIQTSVHDIYDRLSPNWREEAVKPKQKISPEENQRIMAKIRPMIEAMKQAASEGS